MDTEIQKKHYDYYYEKFECLTDEKLIKLQRGLKLQLMVTHSLLVERGKKLTSLFD